MKYDIVLAGVGGQGVLSLGRIIAGSAMREGLHVVQSELHGMSQRGGAVVAHLRISERPVDSSLVPRGAASLILSLEPLEALRYSITPAGLHYLLIHYDIPAVEPAAWRLKISGRVTKPLELSLDELRQRPRRTLPVTMECAGNGRALFAPRRISQPWLHEAIGTAEWTGTPLRSILQEAGLKDDAVELIFTGSDRGVEGEQIQSYQRSLTVAEATRDEVLLAYEMNFEPLGELHGAPLRLRVENQLGFKMVKWIRAIEFVESMHSVGHGEGGYNEDHEYFGELANI